MERISDWTICGDIWLRRSFSVAVGIEVHL
jgi:hypothetical protein